MGESNPCLLKVLKGESPEGYQLHPSFLHLQAFMTVKWDILSNT